MAKMILSDNSPKMNRRKVASSGGYMVPAKNSQNYSGSQTANTPITKTSQFTGSSANVVFTQPMFFSPMHTPQNWQIASKRREVMQWARFYYENEPTIAAGVDFYSEFSMNGFKLECKSKKILKYFERVTDRIALPTWLDYISHEYFLLGDVFPFAEISCPTCKGAGQIQTSEGTKVCNHPDGTIRSIKIMNPDYIEVQDNVLADQPVIALIPDEELKMIVMRQQPKHIFDNLPSRLIELIAAGRPIPLSNRSVSHIKYNASPYGTYGTSLLRRCFTPLAYKTKIMTANWIVAERLILPIRIVKIGEKERPASEADIADVVDQMAAVANDPNLTIVTHHAFEVDWIGASGKIHNITPELEHIDKELLNGLMLNQAILNGEAACHDEDTLVLTDKGFLKHDEVTEEDKIACYNPDTELLEYHPYINKFVYDYDGDMYYFNTNEMDIMVTPNHNMYYKKIDKENYEFVKAEDVNEESKFLGITKTQDIYTNDDGKIIKIDDITYNVNLSLKISNKEIQKVNYKGKVFCFEVPHHLFVTMRNGFITIQGNSYNSAQVGIEVLIRRLESWRNKLKEWVEKHIFLPIAMMQGFEDEEESKSFGETVYLYPKLKFNDLNLRDNSNRVQILMQGYDKQMVSAQTILEELGLDYDSEVRKIREEQVMVSASGMIPSGGEMGGMGGMGGLGGDMGGLGGGGGGMGGLEGMGGEAPMGGEMGMPGMAPGAGMGGAEMGAGAAASSNLPMITKRGKGKKDEDQSQMPVYKPVRLTGLEQKVLKAIRDLNVPYKLFGQYQVKVAGEQRPFVLDFAYPEIGIGCECLHPETYVPTINGIKMAENIQIGDILFGKNSKMVRVEKYIEKQYDDTMYTIKPMGMLPIRVTNNHPIAICKPQKTKVKRKEPKKIRNREYVVPGEIQKIRADEVEKGDYIVIPKRKTDKPIYTFSIEEKNNVKNRKKYTLPIEIKLNEDFGWLMGIYAAEGSSNEHPNASLQFSLNINEIEYSNRIQHLLKEIFNIESSICIDVKSNCRKVISYCSSLAKFLSKSFGRYAHNKEVPSFLYNAPNDCKKSFIQGCLDGDGCQRNNGDYRLISSSTKLLMGIQTLIFSMGFWATIVKDREPGLMKICGRDCETKGLWELKFKFEKHSKARYREDDNNFYVYVTKIDKKHYKGKVINYTVAGDGDSNHTYIIHNLLNFNCDGQIWHEQEDRAARDQQRDQKLANVGWRILRFKEDAITDHLSSVRDIIYQNILEAGKQKKKAEENNNIQKFASLLNFSNEDSNMKISISDMPNNLGQIWLVGY